MTSSLQLLAFAALAITVAYLGVSFIRGKVTAKQKHFSHKMEDIVEDTSLVEMGVLGREVQYQKEREREAREKHRLEEKEKLREIEERRMKSGEAIYPTHAEKPAHPRSANPVVQEKETFYPETHPKKQGASTVSCLAQATLVFANVKYLWPTKLVSVGTTIAMARATSGA
jgi:hypothetical protein